MLKIQFQVSKSLETSWSNLTSSEYTFAAVVFIFQEKQITNFSKIDFIGNVLTSANLYGKISFSPTVTVFRVTNASNSNSSLTCRAENANPIYNTKDDRLNHSTEKLETVFA